jgi:hypothetical protein
MNNKSFNMNNKTKKLNNYANKKNAKIRVFRTWYKGLINTQHMIKLYNKINNMNSNDLI